MVYNLLIKIEKSDFVTFYCNVSSILATVQLVVISNSKIELSSDVLTRLAILSNQV